MTPTSQSGKTLADVARVFPGILDLAGTVASSTLNQYRLDALRFLAYCAVHDISPLSEGSVGSWRGSMIGETRLSPHTINRKIAAIKRIIRASAKTGDLSPDLANRVSLIDPVKVSSLRHRLRKDARTRLEPGEVRRLVSAPDTSTLLGLRDHALLATLVGSGGRISEVVTLQVDNIVQTPTGLLVRLLGKGQSEARAAPLSHEAHEALCAWLTARAKYVDVQAVFTGFHGPLGGWRPIARPLSSKGAWRIVRKYAEQAGIEKVKPHDLRRFVGTQLAAKDLRKAQLALGHKRLETTARHYILDELEPGLTDGLY